MVAFIRRHPAVCYFALAFALSWSGVMAVIRGGPIPALPADATRLFGLVYHAMLVGPPVAGLSMTAIVGGRTALKAYFHRLIKWRVGGRAYLVALGTAPLVLMLALVMLAGWSSDFLPAFLSSEDSGPVAARSVTSFLPYALLIGLGAGTFEELGWTGFAIPALRSRMSVDRTGIVVGMLWGAWHFLAIIWGSARAIGSVPVSLYMVVALFSFLPPYRILMARVYAATQSLFLAIVMHAALTTSMIIFAPSATGVGAIVYDLVVSALLWIVALVEWPALRRLGRNELPDVLGLSRPSALVHAERLGAARFRNGVET